MNQKLMKIINVNGQCELDGCLLCPQEISNQNLCKKCKGNFYPMINDFSNIGEYINCYKELKGFI